MNKTTYNQLQETIYSETMDNGLKVFLLPKPEMSKTFGIFSTDYGSIDNTFVPIGENDPIKVPDGIAHFLEHKLFEKEDRDVFQDFTKRGASANAFTSFTKTAYLFSSTSSIKENVTTLLNFVQDPYFSEQSVEKEKGIIGQEITMYDDQPDWRAFFGTISSLYNNHPVQIDIAGTIQSIDDITKDDLYTCYNTFYHPSNMTFFVAGNFNPEEMMELIRSNQNEKTFPEMNSIEREFPNEPNEVSKKKHIVEMPVSVSKCMVGIKEIMDYRTTDEFLRKELLIDMILDHFFSKSGEFYQELYESDLIDNTFSTETNMEKNFGFSILGGNTAEPDKLADKIKEQLLKIKDTTLSEEEFERIKKKKVGQFLRAMNSLEFISNQFIHYNLLDIDLFEIVPTIESITTDQVNDFIKNWIGEERIAVCQIVPKKG